MTNRVKSVLPVQRRQVKGGGFKLVVSGGQGLWDVRVRYLDGSEKLLCGNFPYTLAQAQCAADSYSYVATASLPAGFALVTND